LDRYGQDVGAWLHQTLGVISASHSTYFIGSTFSALLTVDGILPTIDKDINPLGRKISVKYLYDIDKFNPSDSSEYKNGLRVPVYTSYSFSHVEASWSEHIALPIPKHTFSFSANASGVLGKRVDEFFDYYAGGFVGMRGYPFYAIGGNSAVFLNATYRFPIATEIDTRLWQFYFKKLYASFFCDKGDGWTGKTPAWNQWKSDVGFELRLETVSFYSFPTRIFFSDAYGIDRFDRTVKDINTTTITYGQEWRFYLGILFGFDLNDAAPRYFMR
jgi:hypothetical protein